MAGRFVPMRHHRRAGNPAPDSRRALPDTAALILACLVRIAGVDLETLCPQAEPL